MSYSAGLFVELIAGNPVAVSDGFWTHLGKSLRTLLLAEIIQKLWNANYPNPERSQASLMEIYYEKALYFCNAGNADEARNIVSHINSLHTLKKEWPVYPKLLNLAMRLKGTDVAMPEKKTKGILESLTTAVSDMFQTYAEPQPKPQPQPYKQARNEFYFDKTRGIWVINGQEADAEYDMGQEPVKEIAKIGEVEPPPVAMMPVPRASNREDEVETTPEVLSGAFGKVTIGHNKKKAGHKNLYVAHD